MSMHNNRFDPKRFDNQFDKMEKRAKVGIGVGVFLVLLYWVLILTAMILGIVWLFHHA